MASIGFTPLSYHRTQKQVHLYEVNLFLVLTTGLFFNKINQAESMNDNLALFLRIGPWGLKCDEGDKSCSWIKKVQGALFNSAHPENEL